MAPYGGQTSSSCGGLVVFGHQMGALWAPWLEKMKFGALCTPPSSSCGGLVAFSHLIGALYDGVKGKGQGGKGRGGILLCNGLIYLNILNFKSLFLPKKY